MRPAVNAGLLVAMMLALPGLVRPCDAGQQSQSPAAAQQQPPQPERPLNPTQEIAGAEAEGNALAVGPAQLRIGGFLGLTGLYRSTNSGGGPGTAFATIPYSDSVKGNVSETRLTAETSKLSIRVDASFPEPGERFRKLAGYFETDFSGNAPGNVAVTSSSYALRLRHAFAEVQYGDSIFLSIGQAFTLMTPVKDQLSTWPSDVELTQAVDTNYVAGMVWARLPQVRVTWRPSTRFNWAGSVENPEQQIGIGLIGLPACCAEDISSQYNTGSNQLSVPNLMPDLTTRVGLRPLRALHVDAGGVLRVFRTTIAPYDHSLKQAGGGANVNARLALPASTALIAQGAFGSGLGRYIGGLLPDVAFERDGSISTIPARSWVTGLEHRLSAQSAFGAYYSGVSSGSQYSLDDDGRYIGFGFPGAPPSNNHWIREFTGTFSRVVTKTASRGSVQLGLQTSWLQREAYSQVEGSSSTDSIIFFAQLRYNLP
jgi:hypothetical protein